MSVVAKVRVDGREPPQGLSRVVSLPQTEHPRQAPQLRGVIHSCDSDCDLEERQAPPEGAVVCSVIDRQPQHNIPVEVARASEAEGAGLEMRV